MKKRKLLKSKPLLFLSILVVAFTIYGSIAYFYTEVALPSQFKSKYYSVEVFENFYNDWGTKEVIFENTDERSIPVVLRISYNEIWSNTSFSSSNNGSSSGNTGVNTSVNTSGSVSYPTGSDSSSTESDSYQNIVAKPDEYLTQDEYDRVSYASNTINGENVVLKDWTNEFLNDFILGNDGWYYYKKILNANESVQVLNSVNLNLSLLKDSPYKNIYTNYDIVESLGNLYLNEPTDIVSLSATPFKYNLVFSFESIQAKTEAISDIWGKNVTINGNQVNWNL